MKFKMSNDEELKKLREQKIQQMRQQQAEQEQYQAQQQHAALDARKQQLMQQILSSEARSRLANIRLARPQHAQQIEVQLLQAFQAGSLRGHIPLSDTKFKTILKQLHNQTPKRERKIEFR